MSINIKLDKLTIWLVSNKLILNFDKSHFVIFHRSHQKQNNEHYIKAFHCVMWQ